MKHHVLPNTLGPLCAGLAAVLVALLPAAPAQALDFKTFVSSTGSGTACTRAAPCASFQFAHDATQGGGEINCLDSGPSVAFDGGTITKSITIDCAGLAATFRGFTVNGAGIVVRIRSLSINFGGGSVGIFFNNGAALLVENCVIANYNGSGTVAGIQFQPTAPGAQLVVSDTKLSNNGSGTNGGGIVISPASGITTQVALSRVTVSKNSHGIVADGTSGGSIHGVVRDSVVSGNAHNGITVIGGVGAAVLSVENTTVTGNDFGLVATGGTGMLVGQSSIVFNNTGLFTTGGGVLLSYRNNNVNGNTTTDGAFTGVVGQQ